MSLTHAASGTHFNEPDFNDVVAREPEHVVRVELAWQPAFARTARAAAAPTMAAASPIGDIR